MPTPAPSLWRLDRPAEGFYATELPSHPTRAVRTFLPEGYEPRYPYPLLVVFHARGGNEEQAVKLVPKLSRRNFVAVGLRGPEGLGAGADGQPGCGWDGPDADGEGVAEYVVRAVEQTRRQYHVHSERVYLVGIGDGAGAAYRAAFALGDRVAGVVSLNGGVPVPAGRPLFRLADVRKLRVFIGHGIANVATPYSAAERDSRLLWAAGADVRLSPYPTTHRLHQDMLRDVNRWVIGHVNANHDRLVLR